MDWVRYLKKGLIAATAALGVLADALTPASAGGTAVTTAEWVAIALAGVGAVGVLAAKNGDHPDEVAARRADSATGGA
jgi:hypothetical protein